MKKGRFMELILFVCAVALVVMTGWLYFEKSTLQYSEMKEEIADLNHVIGSLEDDMIKLKTPLEPQTVNVIMKEPIKVYMKQIPPMDKTKLPALPGNIPKLKQQLRGLSK